MIVKICGITRREDAEAAVELGADCARLRLLAGEPALRRAGPRARDRRQRCRRSSTPVGVFVESAGGARRRRRRARAARRGAAARRRRRRRTPRGMRLAGDQGGGARRRGRARSDRRLAAARRRCCSTRTIRCSRGGTGRTIDWARGGADRGEAPDGAGRRADAGERRRRRSRACGRSASTCRRASSGRPA